MDGTLPRLRLSGLRASHRRLRLAHDERAPLRPLRSPGLRQPLPPHTRPSDPADVSLATTGEAYGRDSRRTSRLGLSWLASRATSGPTRRTRSRPSGAARARWRAFAGAPWRALRELQRAQGALPAAAVRARRPWSYKPHRRNHRSCAGDASAQVPVGVVRAADRHFQPRTRAACSIHPRIIGVSASSRDFTLM